MQIHKYFVMAKLAWFQVCVGVMLTLALCVMISLHHFINEHHVILSGQELVPAGKDGAIATPQTAQALQVEQSTENKLGDCFSVLNLYLNQHSKGVL